MTKTAKKILLTVLVLGTALQLSAQNGARRAAPVAVNSPVVNANNTVTFNYRNARAKDVKVNVQFAGTRDMTKNENGVWTVTLGPAVPDIYPYCFIVDGVQVMDPLNPDWFPNETFKNSLLDMRGTGDLVHALKNVPHGSVDYVSYKSEGLGMDIPLIVYTPPFYDNPENKDKEYPVMYLISGTTDTEEVYFKVGKMNLILDNLIAEGKAKEMILVLPYGNPTLLKGGMVRGYNFNKDFLDCLMPYVESNYRTINDADHRGIGGFSRGGNQGLAIGLQNLDKFSYLCSYSSFTPVNPQQFENAAEVNSKIHLFWLGIGTDDFLYGNSKDLMDTLDQCGIKNIKEFTYDKFGHTWMNSRYWLDKSFRLLFQDDSVIAAEKGMSLDKAEKQRKKASKGKEMSRLTGSLMASLFPAGVKSPEYNEDGSVTFRFQAPDAQEVSLNCQMLDKNAPMVKDEKGVWSVTVKPTNPDLYPYCFIVDGMQVADPNNMYIFPNEGFKNSLVDVRGPMATMQDLQDVPHGKVSYRFYHSNRLGIDRPMCVYTPAGYDPADSEKYPVLYLIHGMTDTYETWFKVGKMNNILDNLIAQGQAEKMIVVMPYANPYPELILQGLAQSYDAMNTEIVVREIIDEVMPYVESNFKVKADADHRAVAGFSLGGRQALATGIGNPDKFHYVCAFAPAIFNGEWNTNFDNGTYATPEAINSNLKLLWVSCGVDDGLVTASRGLDATFNEKKIRHLAYFCDGAHTWMNCRDWLELTAHRLFK